MEAAFHRTNCTARPPGWDPLAGTGPAFRPSFAQVNRDSLSTAQTGPTARRLHPDLVVRFGVSRSSLGVWRRLMRCRVCPPGRTRRPPWKLWTWPGRARSSSHKTKRPRPYSRGTNRSNRFLPRETVQPQNRLRVQPWEWHRWAIESLSGSLAHWARAAIARFQWVPFCLPSPISYRRPLVALKYRVQFIHAKPSGIRKYCHGTESGKSAPGAEPPPCGRGSRRTG
jgi:hypothetical protein